MTRVLLVSADRTSDSGYPYSLGDALLTDALASKLRAVGHDVVVADFGSTLRADDGGRVRLEGPIALARLAKKCDRIVLGGGTLLQDDATDKWLGGLSRLCLVTTLIGRVASRRVTYFAVGVDPVNRWQIKLCLAAAIRLADDVVIRDEASLIRAKSYGRRDLSLGGDAALLLEEGFTGVAESTRSTVLLALNATEARKLEPALVQELRKFGEVKFLSMHQGSSPDSAALSPDLRNQIEVIDGDLGWQDAVKWFSRSILVVASRMHGLYLAALTKTPAIAVESTHKVRSFASEFMVPMIDMPFQGPLPAGRIPSMLEIEQASARLRSSLKNCQLIDAA